jgi:alginate O-acetyltransferase complex protein AlgI
MVFSSNIFLFLFLPAFFLVYYAVKPSWRSFVIVAGSYLFYAWWRPDFLLLFLAVTTWNYLFGMKIYSLRAENKKKAYKYLTVAVIGNLLALGYFKYANFGVETISQALSQFGWNTFTLETIILPLGISFYIFQAISYVVDIYRGKADPARRFIDFAAFIALFPQLIAGPILRYSLLSEQLNKRDHSWELFSLGAARFMLGFTKKVFIADSLAPFNIYMMSSTNSGLTDAWISVLASLLQLYFDFSAYSDMAIGLGMMMGFRFAENFNHPFTCMSLTEFWRRWHITLADFLRDYVFTPMVRSKKFGGDMSLFLTMVLSGFWHGASFSYIFFGAYFGIAMVMERRFGLVSKVTDQYVWWKNLIAFSFVLFCMPLFMAGGLPKAIDIYYALLGFGGMGSIDILSLEVTRLSFAFLVFSLLWLVVAGQINRRANDRNATSYFMDNVTGWKAFALWVLFVLSITRLEANSFSPFLYFQF